MNAKGGPGVSDFFPVYVYFGLVAFVTAVTLLLTNLIASKNMVK